MFFRAPDETKSRSGTVTDYAETSSDKGVKLMLSTFDDLRQQILNNGKQLDLGQIQRAYETAEKAHGGQLRVSGEPYICLLYTSRCV